MTDVIESALADGRSALTEAESKRLLAAYGITVPKFREVSSADAAADAAADVGFPVAVKVSSPEIGHKSEWGDGAGVSLGLDSPDAVRQAADRIIEVAETESADVSILVEEEVDRETGVEVIVGGTRNPSFGPTVLVGIGGVLTEVLKDVSHRLAPVDEREANRMLDDLRGGKLLDGYRGRPTVDRDALVGVVTAVGDLLLEHDEVTDVDVNPVLATGDGATALDALIRLR